MTMFRSKTLPIHLARGAVGFGALAALVVLSTAHPIVALLMLPVALVALRGCPMCWTVGLIETVLARVQRRPAAPSCFDGACRSGNPTAGDES